MRTISKEELKEVLKKHSKRCNEEGGERADLRGAYLSGVDLSGAYLSGAYLSGAYLSGADLRGADLSGAYLSGADLSGADLSGVDLSGADLRGAEIEEAIKIKFYPSACPEEGDFIGWKKADGLIVKLLITGKRSSAYSRKCRCSEAKVLAIEHKDGSKSEKTEVSSDRKPSFVYRVGETVSVPDFDEDRWNECSRGIHFFITRREAEEYNG